ncbi:GNAT family N-acetyltransferase [Marinospirillum alkaliphilum]|uniref:Protein N-acetyltransferase, RimJ/RimL family n=1 Tax=Marinospirillum alkaliphilum DSM 21637 TaxID=1122209 RepID=A0A1K1TC52_9GAMM|nr:GNAT family N-acetyltransferase [Marinospirillum alkaliphilum]SFW97996.1 Protein N-acetyltransferase, RimJ/RimL family [Marinospirillum alkaliphilum DSM 21637]
MKCTLPCITPRLVVREFTQGDHPQLAAMLADPEVMKHSLRGVCDAAMTQTFLDWCLRCYTTYGFGPWALEARSSGELVGFCGISPELVAEQLETNLGYRLARGFWGQGLATEAVQAVLSLAFESLQLDSVVVIIEPDHPVSRRVAEKAGFLDPQRMVFHQRQIDLYRMKRQDAEF